MSENKVETEKCVICKKDTGVPVTKNVEFRPTYVEGAGQMCAECFIDVYKKVNKNDNAQTKP